MYCIEYVPTERGYINIETYEQKYWPAWRFPKTRRLAELLRKKEKIHAEILFPGGICGMMRKAAGIRRTLKMGVIEV